RPGRATCFLAWSAPSWPAAFHRLTPPRWPPTRMVGPPRWAGVGASLRPICQACSPNGCRRLSCGRPVTDNLRPVWATVDRAAVAHNVTVLKQIAAPAQLCAVVKADGYGHGAVAVAEAAVGAGAEWLGVALVEEGIELRQAGIDAPVLLLSEPPVDAFAEVAAHGLTPTVYTPEGVEAAAKAAASAGAPLRMHLKIDTGMHRSGVAPERAVALAKAITARDELRLQGVYTHF